MKIARRLLGFLVLGLAAMWLFTDSASAATTPGSPTGALDSVGRVPGGIRVTGWAYDADTAEPIAVHVYDNGVAVTATTANTRRPDVGAANPAAGDHRGFDLIFDALDGAHTICVYAINVGPGSNTALGCRRMTFSHRPTGVLDNFTRGLGGLHVVGWAVDPDTVAPVEIRAYSGADFLASGVASGNRADVGAALPSYGPEHGFDFTFALPAGVTRVCLHAIDNAGQANALVACGQITSDSGLRGSADALEAVPGGVRYAGWALDLDVAESITVHLYADGRFLAAVPADQTRSDVGAAYTGYGDQHGFDSTIALAPGNHELCVYAINVGAGNGNRTLGCRAVTVTP